jgi:light-regulated signal transduction histidine kinase (bacteriophytochrome)
LERSNAELQHFAYIVSHDLTEPLRTMNNFVQVLAKRLSGTLEPAAVEEMTFITDAAQRLQHMLTDLLVYTGIGKTPEFTTVDCERLLARVLNDLQLAIADRHACITHDPLPTLQGDATRLQQVFQNLIGNALKFCGDAPPRIHFSAQRDGHCWRFAIRDNGIGIDPAQSTRIFQVFQRLHPRRTYPGTGIGLAICKRIIEQHGGQIWVESQLGQGATFFFTVPMTPADMKETPSQHAIEPALIAPYAVPTM